MTALGRTSPHHVWCRAEGMPAGTSRVGSGGLRLGSFTTGGVAVLDLARSRPVTVAAFTDAAVAVVLAMRARAVGAHVIARDRDAAWQAASMATRDRLPVTVVGPDDDLPVRPGSFARPVVVFDAADALPGDGRDALPPWWARVLLAREVSFATLSVARNADVVLFGRLTHQQAALVEATWRLPEAASAAFRLLRRWQVGVVTPGRHAVVELEPDPGELQLQAAATGLQHRAERLRRPGRHRDEAAASGEGAGAMQTDARKGDNGRRPGRSPERGEP